MSNAEINYFLLKGLSVEEFIKNTGTEIIEGLKQTHILPTQEYTES